MPLPFEQSNRQGVRNIHGFAFAGHGNVNFQRTFIQNFVWKATSFISHQEYYFLRKFYGVKVGRIFTGFDGD
ncbi:MAG: hypothetical protein Q8N05_19365 [Bacteroidota bacterium]|nr:hypothetical protein [Bacteroidota bacterium]